MSEATMTKKHILIALLGASAVSCGQFSHLPAEAAGSSPCEKRALIEDVEDADDQVALKEGRKGYWYTFKDETGQTEISPREDHFVAEMGGVGESSYAVRMKGKLAKSGEVYAGVGFDFVDPRAPYDATKYTGVSFLAKKAPKSIAMVRLKMPDANTDPDGKKCSDCYNDFGVNFELTDEWTRYTVPFDKLKQEEGWGDPRPPTVGKNELFGLQWQVNTPNGDFDVWIDDVRFEGACGS
jgi:endoglucanase